MTASLKWFKYTEMTDLNLLVPERFGSHLAHLVFPFLEIAVPSNTMWATVVEEIKPICYWAQIQSSISNITMGS